MKWKSYLCGCQLPDCPSLAPSAAPAASATLAAHNAAHTTGIDHRCGRRFNMLHLRYEHNASAPSQLTRRRTLEPPAAGSLVVGTLAAARQALRQVGAQVLQRLDANRQPQKP